LSAWQEPVIDIKYNLVPAALETGQEKDFVQDETKSKKGILSSIRKKLYNVARR
jgi:hypothetical protein